MGFLFTLMESIQVATKANPIKFPSSLPAYCNLILSFFCALIILIFYFFLKKKKQKKTKKKKTKKKKN